MTQSIPEVTPPPHPPTPPRPTSILLNNVAIENPLVANSNRNVTVTTQPSGSLQLSIQPMDNMNEFKDCNMDEVEDDDWTLDLEDGRTVAPFWFDNCNLQTSVSDQKDDNSFVLCNKAIYV